MILIIHGSSFKNFSIHVSKRCKRNVLKFCCFKFSGSRNKLTEVTQAEKMDIKIVMCVTSRMIVEVPTLLLSRNLVLFKMFIKLCVFKTCSQDNSIYKIYTCS